MYKKYLHKIMLTAAMLSLCLGASGTAQASDKTDLDALQKELQSVFVDILCHTTVIRDMTALGKEYKPRIEHAKDAETRDELRREFGYKLRQAWLKQKYDMDKHPLVVDFLDWADTQPMKDQVGAASEWSNAAHRQCPAIAADYRATNGVVLTLMWVIPR